MVQTENVEAALSPCSTCVGDECVIDASCSKVRLGGRVTHPHIFIIVTITDRIIPIRTNNSNNFLACLLSLCRATVKRNVSSAVSELHGRKSLNFLKAKIYRGVNYVRLRKALRSSRIYPSTWSSHLVVHSTYHYHESTTINSHCSILAKQQ